ncbi:hypothetical protein DCAR_0205735 [Daucus carota subsp. sativus]|uniref:Uncharacterized protein n=1 Tax=Daucus carota subsp. sativus TaxID=79200 RepID=A0A175YDP5_DAUCS|nr:hypothetical protein DCAR_0205735 [Daucus carota subsp. sativus]
MSKSTSQEVEALQKVEISNADKIREFIKGVYDAVIETRDSSTVNNPGPWILCTGVTHLQRIGPELVLLAISIVVAGIIETHHKSVVFKCDMADYCSLEFLHNFRFW